MPTAGESQGYRVIVSQRFVGIKPSPTHPTPAFWRMGPSRLVPEERKPKKGSIRWGALSSPLIETGRQLHPTLHFGWYVEDNADRHIEVYAPKILVDAQQVMVVTIAGLWVENGYPSFLVNDPDCLADSWPYLTDRALPALSAVQILWWIQLLWWIQRVTQVPEGDLIRDEAFAVSHERRGCSRQFDQHACRDGSCPASAARLPCLDAQVV